MAGGTIDSARQTIKDIVIPQKNLKPAGSAISIHQSGNGELYSTLLSKQYHTDQHALGESHGISITREYVGNKGPGYSLALGDTVTVKLTVSGLKNDHNYAVIDDQLPAGLVPINESFKNQQYGQNVYGNFYNSYDVTDQEVTENGMVLSIYRIGAGSRTYTYRARVVSEGTFSAPPAVVSLMYAPEIYGRSAAETITVTHTPEKLSSQAPVNPIKKYAALKLAFISAAALIGLVVILGLGIALILRRKGIHKNT